MCFHLWICNNFITGMWRKKKKTNAPTHPHSCTHIQCKPTCQLTGGTTELHERGKPGQDHRWSRALHQRGWTLTWHTVCGGELHAGICWTIETVGSGSRCGLTRASWSRSAFSPALQAAPDKVVQQVKTISLSSPPQKNNKKNRPSANCLLCNPLKQSHCHH